MAITLTQDSDALEAPSASNPIQGAVAAVVASDFVQTPAGYERILRFVVVGGTALYATVALIAEHLPK